MSGSNSSNVFFSETFKNDLFQSFITPSNQKPFLNPLINSEKNRNQFALSPSHEMTDVFNESETSNEDSNKMETFTWDNFDINEPVSTPMNDLASSQSQSSMGSFLQQMLQGSQSIATNSNTNFINNTNNKNNFSSFLSDIQSHPKRNVPSTEDSRNVAMNHGFELINDNESHTKLEENVKRVAFKSIHYQTSNEFETNQSNNKNPDALPKNKRKLNKFKPNIKITLNHKMDFNTDDTFELFPRKFVYKNLQIGSQGIEQMPASFATQSQSQMNSYTPDTLYNTQNIFDKTSEIFNSPLKKNSNVNFKNLDLIRHLGSGAFSTVDLVFDRESGKEYAMKRITIFKDNDNESKDVESKMIYAEIRSLYKCKKCPNIIHCFNASLHDNVISIVLEYMNGNSLEKLLKDKSLIPENVLGYIVVSVLKGLRFLHDRHIVHRDIKPANILLSESGIVKISDFGLTSCEKQDFGPKNKQVFESCKGTIVYMSPERIQELPHSFNCDIWSLGITVAELRSGKFPFQVNGSYFEVLDHVTSFGKPYLDPNFFSEELQSFIIACCTVDPDKRPSSKELLNHPWLSSFKNEEESRTIISSFMKS